MYAVGPVFAPQCRVSDPSSTTPMTCGYARRDWQIGGPDRAAAHLVPNGDGPSAANLTREGYRPIGARVDRRAGRIGEGDAPSAGQPVVGGGSEGGDDGHRGAAGPLPELAALRAASWRSQDNEHHGAEEQRKCCERTLGVKRTVIHTSTMCPGPLCDPVDDVVLCMAPRTRRPLWITRRRSERGSSSCGRTPRPRR